MQWHYENRIRIQNMLVPAHFKLRSIFQALQFSLRLDLMQRPQIRNCA